MWELGAEASCDLGRVKAPGDLKANASWEPGAEASWEPKVEAPREPVVEAP